MPIKPTRIIVSPALQTFARNFKKARKAANMSQKTVHEQTGIAASYVSAVERATRSVTIERAGRLAKAVGVPLYKLLTP
ncbi:helix-turn-helix transcriptional regulator [Dokdonella sp.]|uniref:helix-turn-helix domain-containing protein n=1 Tax=Dokdonella sp. TaxID=2291710 RepID=UPI0027BADC8C|nr:helix-turn-helix transcriptional regulator [Dokdonella sp.]